jgi:hypothetical protein
MPVAANGRSEQFQPCSLCGLSAGGEPDDRHRVENAGAGETADAVLGGDPQAGLVERRHAAPGAGRVIALSVHVERLISSEVASARAAVRSTGDSGHVNVRFCLSV